MNRPITSFADLTAEADLDLDERLQLASAVRARRRRVLGEDIFNEVVAGIFLTLGRERYAWGLAADSLADMLGCSTQLTLRWLDILTSRGLVARLSNGDFALSPKGMDRLRQIYL